MKPQRSDQELLQIAEFVSTHTWAETCQHFHCSMSTVQNALVEHQTKHLSQEDYRRTLSGEGRFALQLIDQIDTIVNTTFRDIHYTNTKLESLNDTLRDIKTLIQNAKLYYTK